VAVCAPLLFQLCFEDMAPPGTTCCMELLAALLVQGFRYAVRRIGEKDAVR
jgi:hypothetical protein